MAAPPRRDDVRELTPGELAAWQGMLRINAWLRERLEAELLDEHGLPASSYDVLVHLADAPDGRRRMNDLAEQVLMSRSGLTRVIDVMERDGLVERVRVDQDGRGLYAAITPAGRRIHRRAHRTHIRGIRTSFLDHLSADQLEQLTAVWSSVAPDLVARDAPQAPPTQ